MVVSGVLLVSPPFCPRRATHPAATGIAAGDGGSRHTGRRSSPPRDHPADATVEQARALAITGRPHGRSHMLRRGFVLLGLAVLLSLLFPVKALLSQSGVDPARWSLRAIDLAAVCALVALLPSFVLFRDGRLAQRIPRWSVWVVLLALFSLLFLLLHVSWSLEIAMLLAKQAVAPGEFLSGMPAASLVNGIELAARLGVLVSAVGVLLNLDAAPDEDGLPVKSPEKRKKK
jgi:hypothetical protein